MSAMPESEEREQMKDYFRTMHHQKRTQVGHRRRSQCLHIHSR